MRGYKRFEEKKWNDFGKNLLKKRGGDKQIDFLCACKGGKDTFISYIEEHSLVDESTLNGETITLEHKFTEREFRYPPQGTQETIWVCFSEVPRETMIFCGFWGYIIIDMIKRNCIKPNYLASNLNGVNETGLYMIDKALKTNDKKIIDNCVRRILRSMGNPSPRGKRIIFDDFYLGKSYWRWKWAKKMSQHISLSFKEILRIFDETSYSNFSSKMHSGKSYISQINTFGGLLLFLNENNLQINKGKGKLTKVIDNISYLSAWKAIEAQDPKENKKEIEKIFKSLFQEPSSKYSGESLSISKIS